LFFNRSVPICLVPSTEMSSTSTEMSHMFRTEMSRYRVVLIPILLGQRGGAPWSMRLGGPNKQVESCFLNHNSSIHFCCTDSLLMTHRGGLSLIIISWRNGGGGARGGPSFLLPWGPKISWRPCYS
jgi:hypothetical protein